MSRPPEAHSVATEIHTQTPWSEKPRRPERSALHLVIAWHSFDTSRVGDSAALVRNCVLGRGLGEGDQARLEFARQRPGTLVPAKALSASNISREQLRFEVNKGSVRVTNIGRCALFHNGEPTQGTELSPGDTLMLQDSVVFFVEKRGVTWPDNSAEFDWQHPFGQPDSLGIVGESESAWSLRSELLGAARADCHVLVTGPSGAGKELAAKAVHSLSKRANAPFVSRSAATFPDTLIDSELFGCAKNYPNVGSPERKGLIGEADGGYLFLDEIGELPAAQQAHLLRVLDRGGEYQRLGESRSRRSDMLVIAATNRDVEELKHDFAARFTARINVAPLNKRLSDLPWLMAHLFRTLGKADPSLATRFDSVDATSSGFNPLCEPRLIEALLRHDYDLNTRELERIVRTALASSKHRYVALTPEVEAELAPREAAREGANIDPLTLDRETVARVLAEANGSPTDAAKCLGLKNRHVFYRLMKKYGL